MGFGSMLFGDPEKRRRERQQSDLDTNYYKRQKIYAKAKEKERERIAALKGKADAQAIANRKPFYQKVIGAATFLCKDIVQGAAKTNPNVFFNWDEPKTKRARRKRRKKK
jgi:hypothetical protein